MNRLLSAVLDFRRARRLWRLQKCLEKASLEAIALSDNRLVCALAMANQALLELVESENELVR